MAIGQDAGGQRVERAAVAHLLRVGQPLDPGHHVGRGDARPLVDDQPAVDRHALPVTPPHRRPPRARCAGARRPGGARSAPHASNSSSATNSSLGAYFRFMARARRPASIRDARCRAAAASALKGRPSSLANTVADAQVAADPDLADGDAAGLENGLVQLAAHQALGQDVPHLLGDPELPLGGRLAVTATAHRLSPAPTIRPPPAAPTGGRRPATCGFWLTTCARPPRPRTPRSRRPGGCRCSSRSTCRTRTHP